MLDPIVIQTMVSQAMGLPIDAIVVIVKESFGLFGAMLVSSAISGGLSLWSKHKENQKAREDAKKQAALAKAQAAFNKKQGLQMYGDDGLYRRQAGDALSHAQTEYERGQEQVAFSWDQAQQAYDLNVGALDYNRMRADEGIDRQNLSNKAALGAFGIRGGSGRERADETITDAREDVAFGHEQGQAQLDMGLENAEKQTEWAGEQLDQGMEKAQQSYGYAVEQADMGKESAIKGYEFASEGIQNQLDSVYDQTGAMSLITAGIGGAVQGAQAGASLFQFGQQYGTQIKADWSKFKTGFSNTMGSSWDWMKTAPRGGLYG
jgi:hypothetical protein